MAATASQVTEHTMTYPRCNICRLVAFSQIISDKNRQILNYTKLFVT